MKLSEKDRKEYLSLLASHPLFALLPSSAKGQDVKHTLLDGISIQKHAKDSMVFLQHSEVEQLYFLLKGQVLCQRELPNGQAYLVANYQEMGLINESVLWNWHGTPHSTDNHTQIGNSHDNASKPNTKKIALSPSGIAKKHSSLLINQGGIHQLTATTKTQAVIATLSVQAYFEAIACFELGGLIRWFCDSISQRLRHHLISSDLLAFVQAKPKLAYYLLAHYPIGVDFEFGCSQKQLATQIGLRPETLSRTLKDLIDLQLIKKDKSCYQLLNAEGLLQLVSE